MPDPDVTVLMPVRDGARFLDSAIVSIVRQTLTNYEFLICDDGSGDATPGILRRYADQDRRIRVITLARVGLVAALNHGLLNARGRWIARMDADDVAMPDRLRLQMTAAATHESAAAIGGAWRVIDTHGRERRVVRPPATPASVASLLMDHNCLAHPAMLFRRDAVLAQHGYREAFQRAEDYDLWLRLSERHPIGTIPDIVIDYRVHPGQVTWRGLEQRILSELGARMAARARRTGKPDPAADATTIDRALLRRGGVSDQEITDAMIGGALGSAQDALQFGHAAGARAALRLLGRQPGLAARTKVHALLLLGESLLSPVVQAYRRPGFRGRGRASADPGPEIVPPAGPDQHGTA